MSDSHDDAYKRWKESNDTSDLKKAYKLLLKSNKRLDQKLDKMYSLKRSFLDLRSITVGQLKYDGYLPGDNLNLDSDDPSDDSDVSDSNDESSNSSDESSDDEPVEKSYECMIEESKKAIEKNGLYIFAFNKGVDKSKFPAEYKFGSIQVTLVLDDKKGKDYEVDKIKLYERWEHENRIHELINNLKPSDFPKFKDIKSNKAFFHRNPGCTPMFFNKYEDGVYIIDAFYQFCYVNL